MHDAWLSLVAMALGHAAYVTDQTMLYKEGTSSVVTEAKKTYAEDIKGKLTALDKQRQIVLTSVPMLKEFRRIYTGILSDNIRDIVDAIHRS